MILPHQVVYLLKFYMLRILQELTVLNILQFIFHVCSSAILFIWLYDSSLCCLTFLSYFHLIFQLGDFWLTSALRQRSGHSTMFFLTCRTHTWVDFNSLSPWRSACNFENAIFNLVLLVGIFGFYHNALRWILSDLTDDKSTLVQVMAWCLQATSHYLSQCWPRSLSPHGVSRQQSINSIFLHWHIEAGSKWLLFSRWHFPMHFVEWNYCIEQVITWAIDNKWHNTMWYYLAQMNQTFKCRFF